MTRFKFRFWHVLFVKFCSKLNVCLNSTFFLNHPFNFARKAGSRVPPISWLSFYTFSWSTLNFYPKCLKYSLKKKKKNTCVFSIFLYSAFCFYLENISYILKFCVFISLVYVQCVNIYKFFSIKTYFIQKGWKYSKN